MSSHKEFPHFMDYSFLKQQRALHCISILLNVKFEIIVRMWKILQKYLLNFYNPFLRNVCFKFFTFFSKCNVFWTEAVKKALCIGPQQGPSTLPCTLLLELQIYKDTTRCATIGIWEVPRHLLEKVDGVFVKYIVFYLSKICKGSVPKSQAAGVAKAENVSNCF